MQRSAQEILELVVFALIAIIVGTGVVWLVGWLLGFVGLVFTWLAGLVWTLLRFLIPLAVVVGGVYLVVRLLNNNANAVAQTDSTDYSTPPSPWTMDKEPHGDASTATGNAEVSEADAPPAPADEVDAPEAPGDDEDPERPSTN